MKKARTITSVTAGALAAYGLILSAGLTAARADTTDELLDILKKKGEITDAKYKELKEKHVAEKEVLPAPPPPGSTKDAGWGPYVTALPKGVGVRIGSVDVKFTGDISFFAIEDFPQQQAVRIDGGLLSSGLFNNSNSIRAGLLPSEIGIGITTNQFGWDIGAFFGAYIGGNNVTTDGGFNANSGGFPVALGTPGIDLRQVYGTIGTPATGTFKFGRDIGIYASDAILNDATLFGSGTPQANFAPANTTLGRIGVGYIYTDWLPQFSYTTPDIYGFTASTGVFTPLNAFNLSGESADITGQDSPMVQGRLKYVGTFGGTPGGFKDMPAEPGVKLTAWTSAVFQEHQAEVGNFFQPGRPATVDIANCVDPTACPVTPGTPASGTLLVGRPGDTFTSWGWDGGVRVDWAGFTFVGYGYTGSGLGQTGLFWDAFDPLGQARNSDGGYVQGSYTFWERLTVGGSWGVTQLHATHFDLVTNPFLFKERDSEIGFVKYKLTDWVNFQAEFVHSNEENNLHCFDNINDCKVKDDAIVFGTTFFW